MSTRQETGTSLAVQWLRLGTSTAGGAGLIPGQGIKMPHASRPSQNKQTKQQQKNTRQETDAMKKEIIRKEEVALGNENYDFPKNQKSNKMTK